MKDNQIKPRFVYEKITQIGEGAFCKAYLVRCKQNSNYYVIKSIYLKDYDKKQKEDSLVEAKILNSLNHPNIIKFNEVFIAQKPNCTLNIVTEYAEGGDLSKRIKEQNGVALREEQILDWIIQICLALHEIHTKKILHRDIKPANCFLSKSDMIKLGDFGISKPLVYTMEMANTVIGTPYFLSPEIIDNQPYSYKCDIWSLGVILYELMTFKMPFEGKTLIQLNLNIVKGQYSPPPRCYSKELRVLLDELLQNDPKKRPSAFEILTKDLCKKRINVLFKEVNYNKTISDSLLANIKEEKKKVRIEMVYLSKSNKPNSTKQVVSQAKVDSFQKGTSDNSFSSFTKAEESKDILKNANQNRKISNTVDSKPSAKLLRASPITDHKINSVKNNAFDWKDYLKDSDKPPVSQHSKKTNSVLSKDKPKFFPVLINNSNEKAKPTTQNCEDTVVTSPYNEKDKHLLYDSCLLFNSLYNIVNNNEIDHNHSPNSSMTSSSNEAKDNYVDDMTETLVSFNSSKKELMQDIGKELFEAAYQVIFENLNINNMNFDEVRDLLRSELSTGGYSEDSIDLVINRFPGIVSIVCNEKPNQKD